MEVDDRVQHELLGTGTIVKKLADNMFLVRFDVNPPSEYNTSQNPCLVFEEDLVLKGEKNHEERHSRRG